jgi:PNKP adenylyltransferase domain, C-terminal region
VRETSAVLIISNDLSKIVNARCKAIFGSEARGIIDGGEIKPHTRGLSTKRSLALREFALGMEVLHRFVEREPLRRVHECVFGVLALESEPVDPRL